jgi:hypothetical protein
MAPATTATGSDVVAFVVHDRANWQGRKNSYGPGNGTAVAAPFAIKSYDVTDGYVVAAWSQPARGGTKLLLGDVPSTKRVGAVGPQVGLSSFLVLKDCSHEKWMWDADCSGGGRPDFAEGDCLATSECHARRVRACNQAGVGKLSADRRCLDFCRANAAECHAVLVEYCASGLTAAAADAALDPVCKSDEVGKAAAAAACVDSGVALATRAQCADYCKNPRNTARCRGAVRQHCVGAAVGSDLCQVLLASAAMAGQHNAEVAKYCAASPRAALCRCLDKAQMEKDFASVPAADRAALLARPDCYYAPCADTPGAYKPSPSELACPLLTLCQDDIMSSSRQLARSALTSTITVDLDCSGGLDAGGRPLDIAALLRDQRRRQAAPPPARRQPRTTTLVAFGGASTSCALSASLFFFGMLLLVVFMGGGGKRAPG